MQRNYMRTLILLLAALSPFQAFATPSGIECIDPVSGSSMAINYAEQKILGQGPLFLNEAWWHSIASETKIDSIGNIFINFIYNSDAWTSTNSRHILIAKSAKGVVARYRRVQIEDSCDANLGFACLQDNEPHFTCVEVDVAPIPPATPSIVLKYPVCSRTPEIQLRLEQVFKLDCADITGDVLKNYYSSTAEPKRHSLDFSNSNITAIKEGDFEGLPNNGLITLDLSHNQLSTLPNDLFGRGIYHASVGVLNLSFNAFRNFPPLFPLLKRDDAALLASQSVDLSHNQLTLSEFSGKTFKTTVCDLEPSSCRSTNFNFSYNNIRILPHVDLWPHSIFNFSNNPATEVKD